MRVREKEANLPSIRISVIGSRSVGKSALTVRYLTKRFIGEYRSDTDMLYKCVLKVEGALMPVDILDTTIGNTAEDHIRWAEAFVVVYSIVDKDSFSWASHTVQMLSEKRPSSCIALVGTKADLSHIREVDVAEAKALALSHAARFHELSSAEPSDEVMSAIDAFLKEVKASRNGGPHGTQNVPSPKLKKISVSKMLGSLIGRSSSPPVPITELIILDNNAKLSQSCR